MKLGKFLPVIVREPLTSAIKFAKSIPYIGTGRYCPVCNRSSRKFAAAGADQREDAKCMHCGALERHRLTWLYFMRETDLFKRQRINMLHVAHEQALEKLLKRCIGTTYLTADLDKPDAMVQMDVTHIQYPDESFDVIYCSHVLEHISDDKAAMSEFLRVLKRDGWAILLVPITADRTFEDPSVTDPSERERLFGQADHVRCYGRDYADRLRDVGFKVKVVSPSDFLTRVDISRMGITPAAGEIYFCTKK